MKAAKDLFKKDDERIAYYEKRPLLKILANRSYHSPELSETDDESSDSVINVYDLSWRSDEVILIFFIKILSIKFICNTFIF